MPTNTIDISKPATASTVVSYWTGMVASCLLGMLAVVAAQMTTPLEPTRVAFDLLRAAVLGAGTVAAFCWFLHREAEGVMARVDVVALRNRNATEAIRHGQDQTMQLMKQAVRRNQDFEHAVVGAMNRMAESQTRVQQQVANLASALDRMLDELARDRGPSAFDSEVRAAVADIASYMERR